MQIGIESAEPLATIDPFKVYVQLKASRPEITLNMLCVLIGAVENRDWCDVARHDRLNIPLQLEQMGLL